MLLYSINLQLGMLWGHGGADNEANISVCQWNAQSYWKNINI